MKFRVTRYAIYKQTYVVDAEDENEALEQESNEPFEFLHEKEDETIVEEASK